MSVATGPASARSLVAPMAPSNLTQSAQGKNITSGGWTRTAGVTFAMRAAGSGGWLHAEVQVQRVGRSFTGATGTRGAGKLVPGGSWASLNVTVSGLKDGDSYMWRGRIVNQHGEASQWVPFAPSGQVAFTTDQSPPSQPSIRSTDGLTWGAWSRAKVAGFAWSSHDGGSGIAGYSYSFGKSLRAPRPAMGRAMTGTFRKAPNGRWILHVWARDIAGNWSNLGYFKFNIDNTAPRISYTTVTSGAFNPYGSPETWTFKLNKAATVRLEVDRTGKWTVLKTSLGRLKAGIHTYTWDGDGARGHMVPAGWYWIRILTSDKLGNRGSFVSAGIHVRPVKPVYPYVAEPGRHVVISLSHQAIYAYDGAKLVNWSLATTGNPALPTPTGHFSIFARFSPFQFISPWPQGSPYYYPPSWTTYAMEFIGGGYFVHDAPWRTVFGPGSNGPGIPGGNYTGTHGCVNVPYSFAQFLWGWSGIGTVVDVIP